MSAVNMSLYMMSRAFVLSLQDWRWALRRWMTLKHAHCTRKCENGGRCIVGGICHCPNGFQPPFCSKRNTTIPVQEKHKKPFSYSLS
ncbi:---NA--- [Octopus vulgaris]|uniref:---NA n=1 Tax=Octopus vulgaris TaxID=6645 RepID=A0AA36C074_OCTVU|nr:---NA--- [Octopus vulgaris]